MAIRVVIATDGFLEPETTPALDHEVSFAPSSDPAAVATALADADALVSRQVNVTREFLASTPMPRLKLVQQVGVGTNRIDLAATRARGIDVANTPVAPAMAVIEHAFLLILTQLRNFARQQKIIDETSWSVGSLWETEEIAGSTVGIYGLGTVGRGIATRALAFDARVLACDREDFPASDVPAGVLVVDLPRLLRESDIFVVAAALTPQTRGAINREKLALMKRSAVIVNIARGAIIDEDALADALGAGRLGGAALDAFVSEPLPMTSPLRSLPGVVITPHAAGSTRQSRDRIWALMRDNLDRLASAQPLQNVVNK